MALPRVSFASRARTRRAPRRGELLRARRRRRRDLARPLLGRERLDAVAVQWRAPERVAGRVSGGMPYRCEPIGAGSYLTTTRLPAASWNRSSSRAPSLSRASTSTPRACRRARSSCGPQADCRIRATVSSAPCQSAVAMRAPYVQLAADKGQLGRATQVRIQVQADACGGRQPQPHPPMAGLALPRQCPWYEQRWRTSLKVDEPTSGKVAVGARWDGRMQAAR